MSAQTYSNQSGCSYGWPSGIGEFRAVNAVSAGKSSPVENAWMFLAALCALLVVIGPLATPCNWGFSRRPWERASISL